MSLAGDGEPPTSEDGNGAPARSCCCRDGETTVGRPTADGAQEAAAAKIPVFTIAFGTDGGSIIDPPTGQTIPVPGAARRRCPEVGRHATGGHGLHGGHRQPSSTTPTSDPGVLGATLGEEVEQVHRADTWQWAAAATALLAAAWALSLWWLRGMV